MTILHHTSTQMEMLTTPQEDISQVPDKYRKTTRKIALLPMSVKVVVSKTAIHETTNLSRDFTRALLNLRQRPIQSLILQTSTIELKIPTGCPLRVKNSHVKMAQL